VATGLTAAVDALAETVEAEYSAVVAALPEGWGRREFAARAVRSDHRGALFLRLDGKDYRPGLWQSVRPAGDVTPTGNQVSEE
jgi:RNA ligase